MKVYIHYNGADFSKPAAKDDVWSNYTGLDSARLFVVSADSWTRRGWQVSRIDTSKVQNGFEFTGSLKPSPVPIFLFNVWHVLKRLAPCWFSHMDVINHHFYVNLAARFGSVLSVKDGQAINTNAHGAWGIACCFVTPLFCDYVIRTLYEVDSGVIPLDLCNPSWLCDDYIIGQTLTENCLQYPIRHSDCSSLGWQTAPLVHFYRGTVQNAINDYEHVT